MLLCPTEITNTPATTATPSNNVADAAPRSYFINGWNDYFQTIGSTDRFNDIYGWQYPMKENLIIHPSDTIILGEKNSDQSDFYMDLLEGRK